MLTFGIWKTKTLAKIQNLNCHLWNIPCAERAGKKVIRSDHAIHTTADYWEKNRTKVQNRAITAIIKSWSKMSVKLMIAFSLQCSKTVPYSPSKQFGLQVWWRILKQHCIVPQSLKFLLSHFRASKIKTWSFWFRHIWPVGSLHKRTQKLPSTDFSGPLKKSVSCTVTMEMTHSINFKSPEFEALIRVNGTRNPWEVNICAMIELEKPSKGDNGKTVFRSYWMLPVYTDGLLFGDFMEPAEKMLSVVSKKSKATI